MPEPGDDVLATASALHSDQAKEKTKKKKALKSKKRSKHNNPPPGTPAPTISAPATPARIAGAEMLDESTPTFDEHSDSTPTFEDDIFIATADYNPFGPVPGLLPSLPSPSAPLVSLWPLACHHPLAHRRLDTWLTQSTEVFQMGPPMPLLLPSTLPPLDPAETRASPMLHRC